MQPQAEGSFVMTLVLRTLIYLSLLAGPALARPADEDLKQRLPAAP